MRNYYTFLLIVLFGFSLSISAQNEIVGNIYYRGDTSLAIPDVVVGIYDLSNNLITTDTTDESGAFEFLNLSDSLFYVRSTTNLPGQDATLTDLYLMLQQIFGFINLEQMEYESADITNDNNVSFSDFSYLLNNIVFNSPLPGDIWQFNESFVDMSNRSNDSIKRDTLIEWGVLEGDVEGVWEPSGRFPKVLNHTFEQVVCNSNEIIEVTIGSDYDNIIKGLDLNIKYPLGYDIIDIVDLKSNITYNIDPSNRTIKLVWLDFPGNSRVRGNDLIKLRLKANSELSCKVNSFELLPGGSILDVRGKRISDITISLPSIKSVESNTDSDLSKPLQFDNFVVSTYPNPVVNTMNIDITIAESDFTTIEIYNINGTLVKNFRNLPLSEGNQNISIDLNELSSGQYFYKILLKSNSNFVLPGQFVKTH